MAKWKEAMKKPMEVQIEFSFFLGQTCGIVCRLSNNVHMKVMMNAGVRKLRQRVHMTVLVIRTLRLYEALLVLVLVLVAARGGGVRPDSGRSHVTCVHYYLRSLED